MKNNRGKLKDGYICNACEKSLTENDVVIVTRKFKVILNDKEIWDLQEEDNVIMDIVCEKCRK